MSAYNEIKSKFATDVIIGAIGKLTHIQQDYIDTFNAENISTILKQAEQVLKVICKHFVVNHPDNPSFAMFDWKMDDQYYINKGLHRFDASGMKKLRYEEVNARLRKLHGIDKFPLTWSIEHVNVTNNCNDDTEYNINDDNNITFSDEEEDDGTLISSSDSEEDGTLISSPDKEEDGTLISSSDSEEDE